MQKRLNFTLLLVLALVISIAPVAMQVLGMQCLSSGKTEWKINDTFSCCKPNPSPISSVQAKCCAFFKVNIQLDKFNPSSLVKLFLGLMVMDLPSSPTLPKLPVLFFKWKSGLDPPPVAPKILTLLMRYNL
jgi:hypothetical protein